VKVAGTDTQLARQAQSPSALLLCAYWRPPAICAAPR